MLTPHLLSLAAGIALAFVAPAWGQQQPPMSASLVNQLQDAEVQEQLIALGVLDSTAGQASRDDLRKAVDWFRRAYQFKRGMEALDDAEKLLVIDSKDCFFFVRDTDSRWSALFALVHLPWHCKQDYNRRQSGQHYLSVR